MCEFRIARGCPAEVVSVFWRNATEEVWYHDIHRTGRVRQRTYAGHEWVLRDKATGVIVFSHTMSAEPMQLVVVGALSMADVISPAPAAARNPAAALSLAEWGGDGVRFVRGSGGEDYWRELDDVGRESMVLEQVGAHYATAWLWWLDLLWSKFNRLDANQQAMLGSLTFVASSQQHLLPAIPWPQAWLRLCRLLRWPPMTLLCLAVFIAGAVAAAVIPIMRGHVLLRDVQSGRELKLTDTLVLMRAASAPNGGGAWREMARGSWVRVPAELALDRSHRLAHAACIACVAALGARLAYRLQ